jgi:hypothetical protein
MEKQKLKYFGFLVMLLFINSKNLHAQIHSFDVGLRFQKTVDLYYENGITGQYYFTNQVVFGASYITSQLGSAMGSNAIKQDNYILSGSYFFRPKKLLQTFLRLNTGYFTADYESNIFKNLQNSSALLSLDGGLLYSFKTPIKLNLSLGYNVFTGDGVNGAGTLYPVFFQTSVMWNLKKTKSK